MILEVDGITKYFFRKGKEKIVANDNVTFHVNKGEIFGLLGQNGAGKTTLMKQIIGLLNPNYGEIRLLGKSVEKHPLRARKLCSVQPQGDVQLGFLNPKQAVTLMGKLRAGNNFDPKRVDALFQRLRMEEWSHVECERLSGGARRLTAFCMAVVVPGELVILDEPTNDVDPVRRRLLWDVIRELTDDGTSVIFSDS